MTAHRKRNKKTALMYGTALGFIFMVSVVFSIQIISLQQRQFADFGSKLYGDGIYGSYTLQSLYNYLQASDAVDSWSFGYRTVDFLDEDIAMKAWDMSKIQSSKPTLNMVTPNYLSATESFLFDTVNDHSREKLSLDSQLYTAKGSQNWMLSTSLAKSFRITSIGEQIITKFTSESDESDYIIAKALAYVNIIPGISSISQLSSGVAVSIPTGLKLFQNAGYTEYESIEDFDPSFVEVKLEKGASKNDIDNVYRKLLSSADYVWDYRDTENSISDVSSMMNLIFSIATYVAMFLCIFSLTASMYTNILEQSKEIAVLRSMGCNVWQMTRIYIYEAFLLIVVSSILGITVGAIVGFTMGAQIALYSAYPIVFEMPYTLLFSVVISAVISALISVISPLMRLMNMPVSQVMRLIL